MRKRALAVLLAVTLTLSMDYVPARAQGTESTTETGTLEATSATADKKAEEADQKNEEAFEGLTEGIDDSEKSADTEQIQAESTETQGQENTEQAEMTETELIENSETPRQETTEETPQESELQPQTTVTDSTGASDDDDDDENYEWDDYPYYNDVEAFPQSVGDSVNGFLYEDPYYYVIQLKEEKTIRIDIDFSNYYYYENTANSVQILLDKVSFNKHDGSYSLAQNCFSEVKNVSSGELTYSKVITLKAGYYIIGLVGTAARDAFDYTLATKDVTTYATSVTIPATLNLSKGKSEILKPSDMLPAGSLLGATWTTSNSAIATVDKNGKVTGIAYGSCNITATLKNKSTYSCKVYVDDPTMSSSVVLLKGQEKTVKVKNTYQTFTYASNNSAIVSVDSATGKLTANALGTATITAQSGTLKYSCKVTVEEPKLTVTKKQLVVGASYQLQFTGTTQKIKWSSSNTGRATVNSSGLVTAKKKGTVTVTGTVLGKSYTCTFTIADTKLKTTSMKLVVGKTKAVEWKSKVSGVKWSSANKKIATVDKKGTVTAKKAGNTEIYAKVGNVKYTCTVTCENPKLSKTSLSITNKSSSTLKVTGTTLKVKWKSSNSSIATVNSSGKVTGKNAGKTTVIATVGGKNLKCSVTVKHLKPSFSVSMSGTYDFSIGVALMYVKNTGKSTLRIYSEGAQSIDHDYSYYDRTMKMIDKDQVVNHNTIQYMDYIDIKPGKSAYVAFVMDGSETFYDTKTTYQYKFKYDGVTYTGRSSYYYGSQYSK